MKGLSIMVLNIKLLHYTWDFIQYQYSVTSLMFKGHIRDILSLESQSKPPPKQDVLKAFKVSHKENNHLKLIFKMQ